MSERIATQSDSGEKNNILSTSVHPAIHINPYLLFPPYQTLPPIAPRFYTFSARYILHAVSLSRQVDPFRFQSARDLKLEVSYAEKSRKGGVNFSSTRPVILDTPLDERNGEIQEEFQSFDTDTVNFHCSFQ